MKSERYTVEKFTCERCEYQWMQRPDTKRDKLGMNILEVVLSTPKNCSHCKSPYWDRPRKG